MTTEEIKGLLTDYYKYGITPTDPLIIVLVHQIDIIFKRLKEHDRGNEWFIEERYDKEIRQFFRIGTSEDFKKFLNILKIDAKFPETPFRKIETNDIALAKEREYQLVQELGDIAGDIVGYPYATKKNED